MAMPREQLTVPEIRCERALVPYRDALAAMERRNRLIAEGAERELVWLLEHPPVYTAGTSAAAPELIDPRFEVVEAGRGGRYTYHGPGQRVGYVLLDLTRRGRDVRCFVHALEGWVIATLADLGVRAWRAEGRIGIWTQGADGREAKIGAIGVRVRRWVTMHGFSVNLDPDLEHFGGIVPCGIEDYGVTSLASLGKNLAPDAFDAALLARLPDFLAALETPMRPHLIAIAAAAALGGCSDNQPQSTPERRTAAGEVLGGETSDAMIPLETARSTSPPARSTPTGEPGFVNEAAPLPAPGERRALPTPEISGGPRDRQPVGVETPAVQPTE